MPRRAPKLSTATAVGESKLNVSEASWLRIEKAFGRSLSDETRCQIITSTIEFIESESLERNAEPLSWTKEKIEGIKKAVAELTTQLEGPGKGDDTLSEAQFRITEKLQHPRLTGRVALGELKELLIELSIACHRALGEIEETKDSGFREGESWDQWVQALTGIAAKCNLPTGASKGSDKSTRDSSPFVNLVQELQECLPVKCRRHTHSLIALTHAISRARAAGQIS